MRTRPSIQVEKKEDSLVSTSEGRYYIRCGRENLPLSPDKIVKAIAALKNVDWSQDVVTSCTPDEALDDELVESALQEYLSLHVGVSYLPVPFFLESIKVTINNQLTRAGLLFLGKKEVIKKEIGDFEFRLSQKGADGTLIRNVIYKGSLWGAVKQSREFLKDILVYSDFTVNDKKYSVPNIDKSAFEEAFINACVHRNYYLNGMVVVDVFDDHIVFSNPGDFFGGITSENIFVHVPQHRNKVLSDVFYSFNWMQRAGMGTKRMSIYSLKYGRSSPSFLSENDYIHVTLDVNSYNKEIASITSHQNYDIPSLILINSLIKEKVVSFRFLLVALKNKYNAPLHSIISSVRRIPNLKIKGAREDIFFYLDETNDTSDLNSELYVQAFFVIAEKRSILVEDLENKFKRPSSELIPLFEDSHFLKKIKNENQNDCFVLNFD